MELNVMPPPYRVNLSAFEIIPAVENVVSDGRSRTEVLLNKPVES